MTRSGGRLPRDLHPLAWWVWAIGLAVATSRTTNPVLVGLVVAVLGVVVAGRRSDAPWARALKYYLVLGLVIVAVRVVFRSVFGGDVTAGQTVLFRLPRIPLPSWAAGVQVGGPVTAQGTVSALYGGLVLAGLIVCIGAANTLANPKRALRVLPRALYELGVAVVVAVNVAPLLVEAVQRARRAQRLRGNPARGLRNLRAVGIPVLEDALERSVHLAAAMDSRGYGRSGAAPVRARRISAVGLLGGMVGISVGAYGLLAATAPAWVGALALGLGVVGCVAGLAVGGRRVRRSSYRPDVWRWPEWAVVAVGLVPAAVLVAGVGAGATGLNPPTDPLAWPTVPVLPAVAILAAALAVVAAPPPRRLPGASDAPGEQLRRARVGPSTPAPATPPTPAPAPTSAPAGPVAQPAATGRAAGGAAAALSPTVPS